MRYILLIYNDPSFMPRSREELDVVLAEYEVYGDWLRSSGQHLGGEALMPATDATTVAVRDGRPIVTEGPATQAREYLGGYYLVEAADLDAAIDAAARIPGARTGRVEIRPLMDFG
jgi:hypothetical protein